MNILTNIVWRFNKVNPATIEEFDKIITRYQVDILKQKASWNPKDVVISGSSVGVRYSAWLKGADELSDNEILLEKRGFFENKSNRSSSGLYQADVFFKLNADNGRDFAALELMYKINRQVSSKDLGGRVYFEGLQEYKTNNGFPNFQLRCGS
nr:hypothetical protein [uncultured Dyadobacter sp.]